MARPRDVLRVGFTLIELLVVIAIIATLAALSVPAIGLAKSKLADVQCENNLRQIGAAIESFKQDNDDRFPCALRQLTLRADPPGLPSDTWWKSGRGGQLAGLGKMFLCPRDGTRGHDPYLGRGANVGVPQELVETGELPGDFASSYCYEFSTKTVSESDWINTVFFPDLPATQRPNQVTWQEGKKHQLLHGNYRQDPALQFGDPFPETNFPIIRCWHHHKPWLDHGNKKKVLNLSYDLNFFWSHPRWEADIDSRFDSDP